MRKRLRRNLKFKTSYQQSTPDKDRTRGFADNHQRQGKSKTEAENAKVKAEKAVTDNRKNIEVAEAVLNKSKDSLIDLQQRTMEEERLLSQKAEDATSSYEEENKSLNVAMLRNFKMPKRWLNETLMISILPFAYKLY